jgi:zinc protease
MIFKHRRLIFITILFLVLTSLLTARAQSEDFAVEDLIVNDPEVRTGTLPNGLTYYVRANPKPAGMAQLRLAVRAGSVLEDEDQLGLAHFVEHMLFNGTERFPENELVDVLESFGMEFGPEINAYTTFDQTVYQLNVNTTDRSQFLLGLDVLEEWAFKATLTEEEFEKERGVVLEEWRVGRGAQSRMLDETYPVLFKGSRYAERRPIGDTEIIANAPVEALRRFYEDWYRPDLMAIIAVGDFDPDETVRLIEERFGRHQGPDNPRPRLSYDIPGHSEPLVKVVHDAEATRSSVQMYVKYEQSTSRLRSDVKAELAEQLFFVMFNQRTAEITRSENPPFLFGYGFTTSYTERTSLGGLAAGVSEDGVLTGMEALLSEAERVQIYGFLDSELERAKLDVYSFFENYWKQRNDLESSDYIQPLLDAFTKDETYPSIDWQWETVQEILPEITLEEVGAVSDVLLSDENRVVIVNGPSVPAITTLTEQEILAVLYRVESAPLDPWVEELVSGPLVPEPPQPGKIVSRSTVPNTDVIRWTLSNGAVVMVLPTDLKSEEILFQAFSRGGYSRVEDEDYISSQFAVDAVDQGGLGGFSADELRKSLSGRNFSISPYIQDTYEGFSGSAVPEDLETMLQLLYMHHTALRRDEIAWNSFMARTGESLKNRESAPMNLYSDLLWETLFDGHFRSTPLTLDRLSEANLDRALKIFSQRFSDASDFTYIFVGDINPDELEPLIELWIGGLPAGQSGEGWVDRGMRSVEGVKKVSLEAGSEPLSVVTQVWTGDWDGSFLQRYLIQSLASALEMQFTKSIREESGGTYSVGVYPQLNIAPVNDYRFIVQFSCAPERVEELTAQVKAVIEEWRSAPPEDKYASDIAASQRRSLTENVERNSWWLGQIVFSLATDTDPEDLMNRHALYDSLSAELLSETARRYLDDSSYVQAVLYPESGAAK